MTLLVLIEHENVDNKNVLTSNSKQLLLAAKNAGEEVIAVSVEENIDTDSIAKCGATKIYTAVLPEKYKNVTQAISSVLETAVNQVKASSNLKAILLNSTFLNKEIAGLLGGKLSVATVTDVTSFDFESTEPTFVKSALNGTHIVHLKTNADFSIVTVKVNSDYEDSYAENVSIEKLDVDFTALPEIEVSVIDTSSVSEENDLETAKVVVCGGRGTEGDFSLVYSLAEQLKAAVGATRVATDEGWVDHSLQIGQTGKTINADLYIGLGVSGAIHHTCALVTCENIVAICDDEDAPIFEIADFGIIGDINDVVPSLIDELQN
ncbi:electron transfer flavoprotein subunit alpha/FixB family protein [Actinomyces sp. zg-332]|uniref:electron transfer flavoprotein subunit alpha/FixB family protein n=1 Tax=Actinomyces sp. zg-332 TaxID=2708340 RepID=UPI00141F12BE|nr:electron transfer flavoprotein subunit alpha/FixB family protein [Actinomyces sp. zg-332]QPK93833.1 electron transfer flavoprotein subunit alpha/FixB family protein [Actinomyces sp. zg-332]